MRVYLCIYSIYNYEHNILTNFAKKKEKKIKFKKIIIIKITSTTPYSKGNDIPKLSLSTQIDLQTTEN